MNIEIDEIVMKVYHIVRNELEYAVGDFIQPKIYCLDDFDLKKRQMEEELENVRKESFPDFPSRLSCLFVCYDMDDVEFWAMMKSSIYGSQFEVLTLEVTKPVFWFSAESYNMFFGGQRKDLHQACKEFWESNKKTELDKLIDREGMTNGAANIIEIKQARISRGKGLEFLV